MASQLYQQTTSSQHPQRSVTIQSSVADVLMKLKLGHHEEIFRLHKIDAYTDLELLTDEQLREIGVWKVGERNRLRRWISKNVGQQTVEQREKSSSRTGAIAEEMRTIPEQSVVEEAFKSNSEASRTSAPLSQIVQAAPGTGQMDRITVGGAGIAQSNGVYRHDGEWDGVRKYSKRGIWKGKEVSFTLVRCVLINDTKRWYISIVPKGQQPGTSLDTDFYSSPQVQELADLPPQGGWMCCKPNGVGPPPNLDVDVEHSVIAQMSGSESQNNFRSDDDEQATLSVDSVLAVAQGKANESLSSRSRHERIIAVDDAGSDFVCGTYAPDGTNDGVKKYSCTIVRGGQRTSISLLRYPVQGNRKRWYLAILAEGRMAGTALDRNFYSAPLDTAHPERPPEDGWVVDDEGKEPPPKLSYVRSHNDSDNGDHHPLQSSSTNRTTAARRTTVTRSNLSSEPDEQRFHNLQQLRVTKAGIPTINGLYDPAGIFDEVNKYIKQGFWKGRDRMFTMFRCLVKGKKKRWYLSICPSSLHPGTVCDVDFYTAPAQGSEDEVPPKHGWVAVDEGRGRGPVVVEQSIGAGVSEAEIAGEGTLKEFPQPSNKHVNQKSKKRWPPPSSLFQSDKQRHTVERVTGPIRGPTLVTVNGQSMTART